MASSFDSERPWAELEAVYELVHRKPDIDEAISQIVASYSGAARKRLYEVAERWGPTFVKRHDGDEKLKRSKLTNFILRRGAVDRRGQ